MMDALTPRKGLFFGTGQFASIQLDAWSKVRGATITGIHGRDRVAAKSLAEGFSIPKHGNDLTQMVSDSFTDFADICTSVDAHPEQIRRCADAGLHILCQKPIAPTLQEARECVDYCESANVRLMINDNWRWQPWYREIKRMLSAGTFGEPRSVHQTLRTGDGIGPHPYAKQPYFRQMPQFLLLETAIHYFDTYRYLFGEPDRLSCITRRNNPAITGEDQAVVTLNFRNGPVVIWDGNRSLPTAHQRPPFNGTLRLEGSEATLDVNAFGEMHLIDTAGNVHPHDYSIPPGYRGGSVGAALSHFIDCLQSGEPFETSGTDYLKSTELVFLAYESAAAGHSLPVIA